MNNGCLIYVDLRKLKLSFVYTGGSLTISLWRKKNQRQLDNEDENVKKRIRNSERRSLNDEKRTLDVRKHQLWS